MLECPYCGHPNPDDQKICEACSQPLEAKPIQEPYPFDPVPPVDPPIGRPQPVTSTNPPAQKRFPWGWAGFGCAMFVLVAAVVVFGVMNVVKYAPRLGHGQIEVNTTHSTTVSNLPLTFTGVNSVDALEPVSLISGMSQALNLNNDTDFQAPKHYTGSIATNPGTSFSLGNGWCAKDQATLKNNLANIQYTFSINDTNIDLSKYQTIYFTDDRGEACAISGLNITPNPDASGNYQVKVTQHFSKTIEDGISAAPYPAGDVTFDFTLRFQAPSGPGLSG